MPSNQIPSSTFDSKVTKAWCNTRAKEIKILFKWTIDNFSLIYKILGNSYNSSEFFDDDYEQLKWYLKLRAHGYLEDGQDYISLYVCCNLSQDVIVNASYKCSLLNDKGEEREVRSGTGAFKALEGCGWPKFVDRDFLFDKSNGLLPENKLIILCEIAFVIDIINVSGKHMNSPIKVVDSKLGDDFIKLFFNSQFCDATLVAGDREYEVHKAILTARSTVFDAMFRNNFKEAKSNRVVIYDIDHDVLKELLHFVYTNEAPNLDKMAKDLFVAADKYDLQQLKKMCEKALCVNLSIETAIDTLILAERYGANQLKAYTESFIHNHVNDVKETKSWGEATKSSR